MCLMKGIDVTCKRSCIATRHKFSTERREDHQGLLQDMVGRVIFQGNGIREHLTQQCYRIRCHMVMPNASWNICCFCLFVIYIYMYLYITFNVLKRTAANDFV